MQALLGFLCLTMSANAGFIRRARSSTHSNLKRKLTPVQNKVFHRFTQGRGVECPVCTHSELAQCDFSMIQDSSCQLPEISGTCDCCPKCLSKIGEKCGQISDTSRHGYSKGFQNCERGLVCSNYIGDGICQSEADYTPELMSIDENEYDGYDYGDYSDDTDGADLNDLAAILGKVHHGEFVENLPLEKGCAAHQSSLATLSVFYPSALGLPLWHPECAVEDYKLYKPVQCRIKETTQEHVCWCVDQVTGTPLVHMHWAPADIDAQVCETVRSEYGMHHGKSHKTRSSA
jgi:hypothetical protein